MQKLARNSVIRQNIFISTTKKIVEKRNDTNRTISNIWFAFGRSCTTHQRPRILFPCPSAVSKQATTLVSYSTHTHIYVCVCIWGLYTYTHTEQLSKVTFTIECHVLRPYPSPPPLTVNTVHNHDWQTLRTRTRYHAPSRLNACADTGVPVAADLPEAAVTSGNKNIRYMRQMANVFGADCIRISIQQMVYGAFTSL